MKNKINLNKKSVYIRSSFNKIPLLIIIASLLIIILLSASFVYSADSTAPATTTGDASSATPAGQSTTVGLGNDFKPDPSLDKQTQENLKNINNYAKNNFGGSKNGDSGQAIVGKDGSIEIRYPESTAPSNLPKGRETFAKIPKGYAVENNLNEFTVRNNEGAKDSKVTFKDSEITIDKDSKVSFSEKNGKQTINILGKGSIDTLVSDGFGGFKRKTIDNIQDATFIKKDQDIISAKFKSINGGKYEFSTNSGKYSFNTDKGGEISYNKETGQIGGRYTELNLPDGSKFDSPGKFSGELDEKGNMKHIAAEGISKFTDKTGKLYSGENLNVYADGSDISRSNENAISFGKNNPLVSLKGQIQYNDGKGLNYQGMTKDSFTEYSLKNFDIKGGDAVITNGENIVTYKNGQENIKVAGLSSSKDAESFTIRYQDENGKITTTSIDKSSGNLYLSTSQNGKTTQTAIVPLSDISGQLTSPNEVLQTRIDQLKSYMNKPEINDQQKSALDLAVLNAQNRIDINNNNIGDAITRTENYLKNKPDYSARLSLAELYSQRAANPDLAMPGDYKTAVDNYQSIKKISKDIDLDLYNSASFGLAETYKSNGKYNDALKEYQQLTENPISTKTTVDNARLGIAQTQTLQGDYSSALKTLSNLNTESATQFQEGLRDGLIKDIEKGLGNNFDQLTQKLDEKANLPAGYKSWSETPFKALWAVTSNTWSKGLGVAAFTLDSNRYQIDLQGSQYEINSQQAGASVFQQMNQNNKWDEFSGKIKSGDVLGVTDMIAEAGGMKRVSEDEILKEYIRSKGDEGTIGAEENARQALKDSATRDNFLRQRYGSEYADGDKLATQLAYNSINLYNDNKDAANLINTDSSYKFQFKDYVGGGSIGEKNIGDTVVSSINAKNILLFAGPTATISVGERTLSVVGWLGAGARAIPGVETGIESINAARLSASEALGLKAVAEAFPKTSAVAGFVGEQAGYFGIQDAISRVPGGEYIAPFFGPIGAEERVAGELERAGIKTESQGFEYFLENEVSVSSKNPFVPSRTASEKTINEIVSSGRFEELGTSSSLDGARYFKVKGTDDIFSIRPEGSSLSIPSVASQMEGVSPRVLASSERDLADFDSVRFQASEEGIADEVRGVIDTQQAIREGVIDPEKYKYFLRDLDRPDFAIEGMTPKQRLESIVEGYDNIDPAIRAEVKQYKGDFADLTAQAQAYNEGASKVDKIAFDDPRIYFERFPPSDPELFSRYREALDYHDLARNKEMRDAFAQMGYSGTSQTDVDQILKGQIKPENLVSSGTTLIGGVEHPTKNYISMITGPTGKSAYIETRWTEIDGKLVLGTAILQRPPTINTEDFNKKLWIRLLRGDENVIDRTPIMYKLILSFINNYKLFQFLKIIF